MRALRNVGAAAPGTVTPTTTSDEAPAGGTARGFRDGTADSPDSATKAFVTARAVAAPAGFGLHQIGGGYLLTRRGWCREVPTLREVGDWLRRIGGTR
jgi:hypothetical protein